jgi:hypothetical protein
MLHILVSIVLGFIGACITQVLGYESPWPWIVFAIVILAYWGFLVLVVDGDWG